MLNYRGLPSRFVAACAAVLLPNFFGLGHAGYAAVVESDLSDSTQTGFDGSVLSTDLINNGNVLRVAVSTTGSIAADPGTGAQPNAWANLTDGAVSTKVTFNDLSHDTYFDATSFGSDPTVTYTLNTAASPNGYSLAQIRSISGWSDSTDFSNQAYTVSVASVASPTVFRPLRSVSYLPFTGNALTPNSSQVTLTGAGGASIADNVAAIRFAINNNGGIGQVFREIDVTGAASTSAPGAPQAPGISIMPLGDSITWGASTNGAKIPGGYRSNLLNKLSAGGYVADLVGTVTTNASDTLLNAGQVNNEGHPGYRIDHLYNNLDGSDGTAGNNGGYWFAGGAAAGGRATIAPDYVLLHIGTNDILGHYDPSLPSTSLDEATFMADMEQRLSQLVTRILTDRPTAHLLLSNLIPIPNLVNKNGVPDNVEVIEYNKYIQTVLVPSLQVTGKNVTFVDQYSNFVDGLGNVNQSLLPDNIHPNQAGYDLMGATWASAIMSAPEPATLLMAIPFAAGLFRRRAARR